MGQEIQQIRFTRHPPILHLWAGGSWFTLAHFTWVYSFV